MKKSIISLSAICAFSFFSCSSNVPTESEFNIDDPESVVSSLKSKSTIIFSTTNNNDYRFYKMDLDGKNIKEYTGLHDNLKTIFISPNGSRIAGDRNIHASSFPGHDGFLLLTLIQVN